MSDEANGANLLLGKGAVYFDRFDAQGNPTGERFLGNVTKAEISTADEVKDKYSSVTAAAGLIKKLVTKRTPTLSLTMDEFTPENVALALMGSTAVYGQAEGTVEDLVICVGSGRWYPVGKRQIDDVVITDGLQAPKTYDLHDDYEIDAVSGRIFIVPGGGIPEDSEITINCSCGADDAMTIKGGDSNMIEGSLRFKGDPKSGPAMEVEIWKATLTTDGVISLISDDYAEAPLKMEVLADVVGHPTEPYYRVIFPGTRTVPSP